MAIFFGLKFSIFDIQFHWLVTFYWWVYLWCCLWHYVLLYNSVTVICTNISPSSNRIHIPGNYKQLRNRSMGHLRNTFEIPNCMHLRSLYKTWILENLVFGSSQIWKHSSHFFGSNENKVHVVIKLFVLHGFLDKMISMFYYD